MPLVGQQPGETGAQHGGVLPDQRGDQVRDPGRSRLREPPQPPVPHPVERFAHELATQRGTRNAERADQLRRREIRRGAQPSVPLRPSGHRLVAVVRRPVHGERVVERGPAVARFAELLTHLDHERIHVEEPERVVQVKPHRGKSVNVRCQAPWRLGAEAAGQPGLQPPRERGLADPALAAEHEHVGARQGPLAQGRCGPQRVQVRIDRLPERGQLVEPVGEQVLRAARPVAGEVE